MRVWDLVLKVLAWHAQVLSHEFNLSTWERKASIAEFRASLVYMKNSKPARATLRSCLIKQKTKTGFLCSSFKGMPE